MADIKHLGFEGCDPTITPNGGGITYQESIINLCSPPQPLPPSLSSFAVSPDNVMIYHTCDGGVVDRCMGTGIDTLTDWVSWVENTIVAPFCVAKANPCTIMQPVADSSGVVSIQSVPIGKVIADCLGMSKTKPHVLYDSVTKRAVAGKISLEDIGCAQFNKFTMDCPKIAPAGSVPTHLLGYDPLPTHEPKWYEMSAKFPMKFVAIFANADSYNKIINLQADQRTYPKRSIERYHIVENSSFDPDESEITVGVAGLYQIDFSIMVNVEYTALLGWVIDMMSGLLITEATNAIYEIRTDERPMYLNYPAMAGQDIILQGNLVIPLKVGDRVKPRVWFNNTYVPSGTQDRRINIWINRSASCMFSVCRMTDNEVVIG